MRWKENGGGIGKMIPDDVKFLIRKCALKNAIKYGGKADENAVLKMVFNELTINQLEPLELQKDIPNDIKEFWISLTTLNKDKETLKNEYDLIINKYGERKLNGYLWNIKNDV